MTSDNEKNHTQYADLLARIRAHCEEAIWAMLDYQSRIWCAKDTSDLKVSAGRKRNGYESWRINTTYILLTNTLSQAEDPNLAFPPATQQQIMETEQKLGFSLPPLLRLLYTEVANGGFGPGYGMRGADLLVAASLEEWLERWLVGEQLQFL